MGILRRYGSLVAKMQVPFKAQPAPARPDGRASDFCGVLAVPLPAADSFGSGHVNLATTWVDSAKPCCGGGIAPVTSRGGRGGVNLGCITGRPYFRDPTGI